MLGSIQSRGNQQFGTEKTKSDVNSLLRKLFPGTKRTIQKAHKDSAMSFSQFIKADPSILFKLENRNVIEGNIKATVSSDSISSLGEINKSSNLKPSDEVTKSNFGNFLDGISHTYGKVSNYTDKLSKNCALMKNKLKKAMPTIGKTKSNPIVPKELKSILKGIISVPYNFAKNTLTFGTEATASSALLLTETISNSYLTDEKLTQKKDTLQIKLNEENQKVMEKNDEIRELLILVSDNVNISSKDALENDGEVLKKIYDDAEKTIDKTKSEQDKPLTSKQLKQLHKEALTTSFEKYQSKLKGSYINGGELREDLTFDKFLDSFNQQNNLYFKFADDTVKPGYITFKNESIPLHSEKGKAALKEKITDQLKSKLEINLQAELHTVENEEDKKDILDKKLEDCLETVKTCKDLAMKNSSDNDLKEIFRQLKNNDTVGLFRDEYYQLSGNLDTTSELKAEIESIDDIKSMDRAEMDSYIVDKSLDVIDNAGNSLWSLGLTGSLFGILPLAPISVIGGGLVMTSKGMKVVNNGLRLAYSSLVKNNDLKKAEQLGKEINDLKKITVKAGKTLEEFVNNNIKELEKELAKAEGDETKTKKALETFSKTTLNQTVGESSIKGILTEINKKTGELKDQCERAIKHKRVATQANRETLFDAINFLTWATFITAAGIASQVAVEGGDSNNAFGNYMTDSNKLLTPGSDPYNQLKSGEASKAVQDTVKLGFDQSSAVNATLNTIAFYGDITLGNQLSDIIHGHNSERANGLVSDLKRQESILQSILKSETILQNQT